MSSLLDYAAYAKRSEGLGQGILQTSSVYAIKLLISWPSNLC